MKIYNKQQLIEFIDDWWTESDQSIMDYEGSEYSLLTKYITEIKYNKIKTIKDEIISNLNDNDAVYLHRILSDIRKKYGC